MKYKKSLLLMLSLNLTSVTTIASPNDTILLKAGERAPITGAFIPEYRFKELETDARLKENFQDALAKCEEKEIELEESDSWNQFKAFLAGVGAGGFLVWMENVLLSGKK